jgi:RNA polymerase sigma-70 factor (ECF subfamily)
MGTTTTPDPALDARLQELLGGCAARDPAALKQLYKLSSPIVFACLARMLRRRSVVEEALQDVFIAVWQRADQYRADRARALTWIVSIARYKAIDLLRRERFSPLLVADPSEFEGGAEAADSEVGVVFATEEALLDKCLRLLTTAQRRSLELAFVGGHSHDEVARVIGSPLGTVKSWIRRGLSSLRTCIESS